mmetsp:Transcript_18326/g.27792  ORF Transcript_18326/g.27792 Transcript_18326/m.27792 type:complete len:133 (-) Transcript_18326:157-555(-)
MKPEKFQEKKCKRRENLNIRNNPPVVGTRDIFFSIDSSSVDGDREQSEGHEDVVRKEKKVEGKQNASRLESLRKYGKRSSRGALIPKRRFDVEMKLDGTDALIQRSAKRRKNKKKQNRDAALVDFAIKNTVI